MTTTLIADGARINHAHSAAVSSGDVVIIGSLVAVASQDALADVSIPYYIEGVHTLNKVTGADIGVGSAIIWDASASKFDDKDATPATGDISVACIAMEASGTGATTVKAKINVGVGTVNAT